MASSRQRRRSSPSIGILGAKNGSQRLNSMNFDDRSRSSIGSQLPEDFFDYLDQQEFCEHHNSDRLLTRFGKRLFARFRNNPRQRQLHSNQSNITVLDSELESNISHSTDALPKRAFSLLSIGSFRRNRRRTAQLHSAKRQQVGVSKGRSYVNDMTTMATLQAQVDDRDATDLEYVLKNHSVISVELKKESGVILSMIQNSGFGFNVVGGTDDQHIPGDSGIFISFIRANTAASREKRMKEGDRIISINGISLSDKTHGEAVRILRSIEGVAVLLIEQDAEFRALSKPTLLSGVSSSSESLSSNSSKKSEHTAIFTPSVRTRSSSMISNTPVQTISGTIAAVENKEDMSKSLDEVPNVSAAVSTAGSFTSYIAVSERSVTSPEVGPVKVDSVTEGPVKMDSVTEGQVKVDSVTEGSIIADLVNEIEQISTAVSISTASPFTPMGDETAKSIEMSENQVLLDDGGNKDNDSDNVNNDEDNNDGDDDDDGDRASTISCDARSVLDDVPRTPKRPPRLFDPSNTSIFNEIMFASAGVVALGVGVYLGYQFLKRRSIL